MAVLCLTSITLGLFIGLLDSVDIENGPNNQTSLAPECTGMASKVLKSYGKSAITKIIAMPL